MIRIRRSIYFADDPVLDERCRTADISERNRLYEAMTKIISARGGLVHECLAYRRTVVAPQIRNH